MGGKAMTVIEHVTCPICGCLCYDIALTVNKNEVVKIKNGCAVCEAKFLGYKCDHRIRQPLMRKDGKFVPVTMDEAIHKAAEILANANYPILYGWSSTNCEAQHVGVELAEEVGGIFDNTAVVCHGPSILGTQEVGIPTATLGQIRHRADVIIYWGCDPWSAHPRHLKGTPLTNAIQIANEIIHEKLKSEDVKKDTRVQVDSQVKRNRCCFILSLAAGILKKEGRKIIVVDVRKTMLLNG
jgi:formylmethanofuran dehydrogenase subunit B